jgi:hypothetical protein
MNTQPFQFGSMLSHGWESFKKHWKFILLAGLATAVIYFLMNIVAMRLESFVVLSLVFSLVTILISIIITLGWAKIFLAITRNNHGQWETFKTKPAVWLRYVKTYIWFVLYLLVCSVGSAIPGAILATIGFFTDIYWLLVIGVVAASAGFVLVAIYYMIRYQFLNFAVLDYPELSSRNIFKRAGIITKGNVLRLFGFGVIVGLVNILGVIPLGLGLIVTIPMTKLAQTNVYNYLKEQQN